MIDGQELRYGKPSKTGQKDVLSSINCRKTTRARRGEQNSASDHNSETDPLPQTRDLKGTSPPRSVPPTVRRANLMLDTWCALHTVLGLFAVFLRDNINRVIISGMILPGVALAGNVGRLDTTCGTHIDTTLLESSSVRFASAAIFEMATYASGRGLNEACVWHVVSGGTQINTVITHGCKNVEEKRNKVSGGENQEINGGILEDLAEKSRHTTNTGKTSHVKSCGIYDDN